MEDKLRMASNILKENNQEHLLAFYSELSDIQKLSLINQILTTNFKKMNLLYENSKKDDSIDSTRISPIPYFIKSKLSAEDINKYTSIGTDVLKKR